MLARNGDLERHLVESEATLEQLPEVFATMLAGGSIGRTLVTL